MFCQSNRHFSAAGLQTPKAFPGGKETATWVLRICAIHNNERQLIMKPVRILLATGMAAGTVLLSASAASAATPTPGPTFGHHVSTCARTMGFSGSHNPSVMGGGMSGMDMAMTASPVT